MHCNSLMAWSPWQSPCGLHEAISRAVGAMAASMGISFVCLAKVYSDMRWQPPRYTTYSCVLAFQSLPNNSHLERPDVPTRARKWMNCRPRQNVWIGKPLPRVHEKSHAPLRVAPCTTWPHLTAFLPVALDHWPFCVALQGASSHCVGLSSWSHDIFQTFCVVCTSQGLSECPEVKSWLRFMMWAGGLNDQPGENELRQCSD